MKKDENVEEQKKMAILKIQTNKYEDDVGEDQYKQKIRKGKLLRRRENM